MYTNLLLILFSNSLKDLYHGSEITSIRVGNDTKRDIFYGGEKNLTKNEDVAFEVLVHLAEANGNTLDTEEKLQSVLESPIKDTKLPLGADVTGRFFQERIIQLTYFDFKDPMIFTLNCPKTRRPLFSINTHTQI